MKQTRSLTLSIVGAGLLVGAALFVHFQLLFPQHFSSAASSNKTPVIAYHGTNNSSRPTMTETDKKQADAPGAKTPTASPTTTSPTTPPLRTANAPKQDAIRDATKHEYTYYPSALPPTTQPIAANGNSNMSTRQLRGQLALATDRQLSPL